MLQSEKNLNHGDVMKQYLITGGTGLIGSALCKALLSQDNKIIVLSRNPSSVAERCGKDVTAVASLDEIHTETRIDVVINLAGEPIADKRWTTKRKQQLTDSRVAFTKNLVEWLIRRKYKPECLISGSAVGWYGDQGEKILNEQCQYNDEFTHQLCDAWEQQALRAGQLGIRVGILRTGLVLSPDGGFLSKIRLPFQLGLGGKLGTGQQYMPWIHIDDMVELIQYLVDNEQLKGIFNACSPSPVSNAEFTKALAQQLHRPAWFGVPSFVLKLMLGEMSRLLLTGQRAIPTKLAVNGFKFDYTELELALANVLSNPKEK